MDGKGVRGGVTGKSGRVTRLRETLLYVSGFQVGAGGHKVSELLIIAICVMVSQVWRHHPQPGVVRRDVEYISRGARTWIGREEPNSSPRCTQFNDVLGSMWQS
jgi:hypothetical protein